MTPSFLRFYILLFTQFLFIFSAMAQDEVIHLNNPSFEGSPRASLPPRGWFDCGAINFPLESPPDIHPTNDTVFGVIQQAYEGDTYLGMIVRENGSNESVSQKLNVPLEPDQCYSFGIYLCRSQLYQSHIRGAAAVVNFTAPLKLKIWGGSIYCNKRELLAESPLVTNTDWQNYIFKFSPTQKLSYIILEAYFSTPVLVVPNGNILLDHASPIIPMSCDSLNAAMESIDDARKKVVPSLSTKIKLEDAKSIEDVDQYILWYGKRLSFLDHQLTELSIQHLNKIVEVVQKFPDQKLLFYFDGMSKKNFEKRKQNVKALLKEAGLTEDDFEIEKYKSKHREILWIVDQGSFAITLMDK